MALPGSCVCFPFRRLEACGRLVNSGHKYVTLKVCERNATQATREVAVYRYLTRIKTNHIGSTLVRTIDDAFEVVGCEGFHQCLVHKPLGMSLSSLRARCPSFQMPEQLLKLTLTHILHALDFLHTEARVVHTGECDYDIFCFEILLTAGADLQQNNILMAIEDESILAEFEEAERSDPSPRKVDGGRITHTSRELSVPRRHGRPVLCDFGEARFGEKDYDDDIQPYLYRAPEVILQVRWDNKVDIWNVGVLVSCLFTLSGGENSVSLLSIRSVDLPQVWDLFQNKHMFDARDTNKKESSLYHLAEMIALLGPPPRDFLKRSAIASEYFDEHGPCLLLSPALHHSAKSYLLQVSVNR